MKKRGLVILGVVVLLGVWAMVIGYEFLEKENALWQKKVKAAKDEQRRCEARNSKYRNFDPSSAVVRRVTQSIATLTSFAPASGCRTRQTFRRSAGCYSSTPCGPA